MNTSMNVVASNFTIFATSRKIEKFFESASVNELLDAQEKIGKVFEHKADLSHSTIRAAKKAFTLLQEEAQIRNIVLV
jgi:hypothetical protein